MALLVDISRLVENLHLQTPTGIDRVELAYVQHFLRRSGTDDVRFVVTWPYFSGVLDTASVRAMIDAMSTRWSSQGTTPARDANLQALRAALDDASARPKAPIQIGAFDQRKGLGDQIKIVSTLVRSALRPLTGRMLADLRRRKAWYIHVSQFRLNRAARFRWMDAANARGLFMLHDIIPILHPEYCRPGEAQRHASRVDTIVDRASVIVTNSDYTRQSLLHHYAGRDLPLCEVVPLGLAPEFRADTVIEPVRSAMPYFVVVGTIEPRKNLEFLLTLWRRWTREGNAARARLVIVGRRGWEIETVATLLDRSVGLAPSVIEARSLSDSGMIALMRGAAALIAPSWVEGFGLPVAEALALGVPVLASDIEAHREVGGPFADYTGPLDGPGWMQALTDYSEPGSARRQARLDALKGYRPSAWAAHMERIEELIA